MFGTQTTQNFITATASVERISPPRAWPHPPPTMRSCFTGREGIIAREIVASHAKAPPAFCSEAKVAKGGAYLWDTTVIGGGGMLATQLGVAFGIYDWSHHKSLEDLVTIPTKLSDNGLHHHGNQNYNICGLTAEHEISRRHSRPCLYWLTLQL